MRQKTLLAAIGILSLSLLGGCNWLRARDAFNNGVQAYSATNYSAAVEYFQEALENDPEIPNAELYMAMAYMQQYVPNSFDPDNERYADLAIETFESVLAKDPNSATAIAGLANIYQNRDELDRAREYYLRQAEVNPEDPVAHYSVGSINWNIIGNQAPELVYGPDAALPLTAEQEAMSEEELAAQQAAQREEFQNLIEEGQQSLDRALELNPNYEDAMTFKNLLYRMAADMIPEDTEDEEALARKEELVAQADEWHAKALETREANAAAAASATGLGGE